MKLSNRQKMYKKFFNNYKQYNDINFQMKFHKAPKMYWHQQESSVLKNLLKQNKCQINVHGFYKTNHKPSCNHNINNDTRVQFYIDNIPCLAVVEYDCLHYILIDCTNENYTGTNKTKGFQYIVYSSNNKIVYNQDRNVDQDIETKIQLANIAQTRNLTEEELFQYQTVLDNPLLIIRAIDVMQKANAKCTIEIDYPFGPNMTYNKLITILGTYR